MLPNKPAVLGPWLTAEWPASADWVVNLVGDSGMATATINYAALRKDFKGLVGPVTHCGLTDMEQQVRRLPCTMPAEDFLRYMEHQHVPSGLDEGPLQDEAAPVYLKDFHFQALRPQRTVYVVPSLFEVDWLNDYCLRRRRNEDDDFRFVYLGPAGSFTPLHTDVLGSFSWSSNVCGRKECTCRYPVLRYQ